MPPLAPVAANVVPGIGARYYDATAGQAIVQGNFCYIAPDNEAFLAISTANPAIGANVRGVAVNAASIGQPVRLQTEGENAMDADAIEGTIYVLSATSGAIAPAADLIAGNQVVIVGVGTAAGGVLLHIFNSLIVV